MNFLYKETVYPQVNLHDQAVMQGQLVNVANFRKKWVRLFCGATGMIASAIIGVNIFSEAESGWITLFFFAFGIPTVFFAMSYKCPHCGTMPAGSSYSFIDNSVSYTKGFHLFPKRCICCGYYLSERALKSDLKKAKPLD